LGAKGEHASTCRFFDATAITRTRVARFRGGVIGSRFIRQKKERGHSACDPSFSRREKAKLLREEEEETGVGELAMERSGEGSIASAAALGR